MRIGMFLDVQASAVLGSSKDADVLVKGASGKEETLLITAHINISQVTTRGGSKTLQQRLRSGGKYLTPNPRTSIQCYQASKASYGVAACLPKQAASRYPTNLKPPFVHFPVAAKHARIDLKANSVYVTDLETKEGTYIEDNRLRSGHMHSIRTGGLTSRDAFIATRGDYYALSLIRSIGSSRE
eukprot:4986663-Pyramimonas_sp.AAC.1